MGIPVPQNKLPQDIQRPRVVPANKLPKQYAQSSGKAVPQNKLPQGMKQPEQSGGFWRGLINQLGKPVASASNLLEDSAKTIGFGIANMIKPELEWNKDAVGRGGIDFLGHQKDVWTGKNKRTFSDITREIADEQDSKVLRGMMKTTGYGADFILDPLNKVKILSLTQKGNEALKTGKLALSAADQAKKGQRALLQFGNTNILPSVGNRVLAASTKANDAIRATKYGAKAVDLIPSTSVRPSGVTREEWKVLRDATVAGKNVQNYTKDKAIQFAADIEKSLRDKGAAPEVRSALLHAIEKGDKTLAPQGFDDVFEAGVKFKGENEAAWKALGGSTLDNYGLAHVATDEVADAASQKNLRGAKLFSSDTPQDIHREWVKVDGKVANLKNSGIKYSDEAAQTVDDPLLQEARKYKSAEEFVKAQGKKFVHETDATDIKEFTSGKAGQNTGDSWLGRGVYLQEDGTLKLEKFGKNKVEAFLSPKAKVFEVKDTPNGKWRDTFVEEMAKRDPEGMTKWVMEDKYGNFKSPMARDFLMNKSPKEIEELLGKQYDALIQDGELVVYNPSLLKTKSQLTDLYNQATGGGKKTATAGGYVDKSGNPVNVTEARKYKSAEEFTNSSPSYYHVTDSANASSIEKGGFTGKVGERSIASKGDMQEGTFLYPEKESTSDFSKNFKNPVTIETKVNGKIYDANRETKYGWEDNLQTQEIASDPKILAQLKKDGYVGVTSTELGTPATFVFDKSAIKTKSQLTDLYHQATGGGKKTATAGGYVDKAGNPVNVTQATAKEINEAMAKEGKSPLFKEDLPTVVARMGISTGRKQAGVEFLEATKGLEGKAKELANEAYEKMTNVESIRDAIKAFDKVQNIWKAQVLVAPSYHIRNEVGNLWNNFLANVGPDAYVKASALQGRIAKGTLSKADEALVETMKKQGVVGTGQYGGDITQAIADELGGASWNPLSQRFGLYKANRAVGSAIEDNAKIAHYIQRIGEGYTPKAAAESVKKYLFDYGDLTWGEQNILKRAMPFYTWTRKNVPLQIEQFFNKPGKFSNAATLQRNIEEGVETPNERYLNDYIKSNTPMRISTNADGSTSYLLLGQWLPAASAVQILSQDPRKLLEMLSPVYKVPSDMIRNKSFFKDTLGEEQPIEKYPNEMKSYLGMDMGAKTANILRNIRILNEIDKLNPGGIFGGKDTPSMIPGGSQNRGARQTPDAPGMTRLRDFIVGKTQTYDPENAKTFYDRDTERRMGEYTQGLDQALRFKNDDQAKKIIREMEQFKAEREGGANKVLDQYNLMGDRYLDDRFKNKQAEYARKDARDKMKELIKEGVRTQNPELLRQAAQLDPTYLKDAIKAVTEELAKERIPDETKRQLYELGQYKTEQKMKPFYTK